VLLLTLMLLLLQMMMTIMMRAQPSTTRHFALLLTPAVHGEYDDDNAQMAVLSILIRNERDH